MSNLYGEIRSILSQANLQAYYDTHLSKFHDDFDAALPRKTEFYKEAAIGKILSTIQSPLLSQEILTYLMSHPQILSHEVSLAQILQCEETSRVLVQDEHIWCEVSTGKEQTLKTYVLPFGLEIGLACHNTTGMWKAELRDHRMRFTSAGFTPEDAFNDVVGAAIAYEPSCTLGRLNQWLKRGRSANLFGIPTPDDFESIASWGDIIVRAEISEDTYRADVPPQQEDLLCIGEHIFKHRKDPWGQVSWAGFTLEIPLVNTVEMLKDFLRVVWETQTQYKEVYHPQRRSLS